MRQRRCIAVQIKSGHHLVCDHDVFFFGIMLTTMLPNVNGLFHG